MQRRLFKLASVSALLGMVACTAIAGLDGEFGLSNDAGGASSSGGTDGSTDAAADGARLDGSEVDGEIRDSGPPDVDTFDATLPAPTDTTSSKSGWCKTQSSHDELFRQFCYDFDGVDAAVQDYGGIPEVIPGNRSGMKVVDAGAGAQAFGATLSSDSAPYLRARVGTVNEKPAGAASGTGYLFTFRFRVASADSYALIAALDFHGKQYGLAVYPHACGPTAEACLGEGVFDQGTSTFSVKTRFTPGVWYDGRIELKRTASGWSSELMVGDRVLARRIDMMPLAPVDADMNGHLMVGARGTAQVGADTQASFDEMVVWRFPDAGAN